MRARLPVIATFSLLSIAAGCADDPALATETASTALEIPPTIAFPADQHIELSAHAFGFQIYECTADATGKLAWSFRAPAALLSGADGAPVAVHFGGVDAGLPAGAYWLSIRDGSRVHGGNAISAPSASPSSIPQLRLAALDTAGDGIFTPVAFIQRLATVGGVGPTGACTKAGLRSAVPYTADYVFSAPPLPRPTVPDTIAVAAGNDVAWVGHATGAQVYECDADPATGATAWKLRAPRAVLSDDAGHRFADHFGGVDRSLPAGAYWQSVRDGSRIHGGNAVSAPSATPSSIPQLRLQALDVSGTGVMSRVSFVQRLATIGGLAPTTPCATSDAFVSVAYTADYFFYVPVP